MREINAALNADEEQYRIANSDKVGIYNVNARIKMCIRDRVVRGAITDRNGNVLAETQWAEDGSE